MKENNNIDDLFKKGLKNLDSSPSPKVWENIQAKLKEEKQDRKVVPLWIKLGGIAAVLALLLSVGNWVFDSSSLQQHSITSEDSIKVEDSKSRSLKIEQSSSDTEIVQIEKASENIVEKKNHSKNDYIPSDKNAVYPIASKVTKENSKSKEMHAAGQNSKVLLRKEQIANKKSDPVLSQNQIVDKGVKENLTTKENIAIAQSKMDPKQENDSEIAQNRHKKSLLDAIAENKDELATAESKKEFIANRWNVAPVIAPVYYSSFGNGSSIDPNLAKNPQSGDVNMSYGVQVGYAVNKRLSIRTGINNLDLSYSTSGVEVASAPVARGLPSVNYGGKNVVLTVFNKGTISQNVTSGGFSNINLKSTDGNARVIQNINYYEVPVELKYALINEKFGINLIGGLSTLILGNNEISVRADDFSAVLGEANNLSDVSFSTNIGLGLDYKISKHFTFNIEPMFKYQINPYTDSSVDFKPYYLGIYSGLNFKF